MRNSLWRRALLALVALVGAACERPPTDRRVITFPMSALGAEATVLERQLTAFMALHPDVQVVQRRTPDAADQRHQLYVQWLNARARDPDVLQVDVIWTPEFAAAGWILPLDDFGSPGPPSGPPREDFFPATIEANVWEGRLYALPWFVDVGMLYWRTDLMSHAPATLEELARIAGDVRAQGRADAGFVWQGARYEGLVTVFVEVLGGMGGEIVADDGRVVVDEEAGVRALTYLLEFVRSGNTPSEVLAWQEEQTRFAFQNGRAAFMRNWPYAYPLMNDSTDSRVAGRFAIAPMPASGRNVRGGAPTAALGGAQLAINANTEHPDAAYALIEYLTRPEQMLERARVVGQYPTRVALYGDPALATALPIPPADVRRIVERAVPRPVTPVYTELSGILQVWLHRALTGQVDPRPALQRAATEMRALLRRVELVAETVDER